MKIKIATLLLLIASISVYAAVDIIPISPYVNRGVSLDLHLSYNPMTITHYYEQKPQKYEYWENGFRYSFYVYSGYSDIIQFIKNDWEPKYLINVGFPNEKIEISASVVFFPITSIKTRFKFNHICTGENEILKNLALSSFCGFTFKQYQEDPLGMYNGALAIPNISNIILYSGISLGTRKKIDDFSYFEIFTNPHFSFTQYRGLGNDSYDPAKILSNSSVKSGSENKLWIPDFSIPVGIGFKYKAIYAKTGFAFSTPIGGEARDLNRDNTFLDEIIVDTNNLSFFC